MCPTFSYIKKNGTVMGKILLYTTLGRSHLVVGQEVSYWKFQIYSISMRSLYTIKFYNDLLSLNQ